MRAGTRRGGGSARATWARAVANFHGFKILFAFSAKEQKRIQKLNLNLVGINRNKALYLKHFVIPGEESTQDPTSFLTVINKISLCLAQGLTRSR